MCDQCGSYTYCPKQYRETSFIMTTESITVRRIIIFIGLILVLLHSFGIQFSPANLFELGAGFCFAGWMFP